MKILKNIIVSVLIAVGGTFAVQGIAQDIKLNAIKPVNNKALTDEQQAILAVRTAKASVVNIVGVQKAQPVTINPGDQGLIVTVPPSGVSGTGFVIQADGLIVTNNHVVEETGLDYFVVLSDGTEYPATVLGKDKFDDIALIKVQANNLIPAKLGDSDTLETGQTVFAIGNSLGRYQNTVTRGVISGLSRAINSSNTANAPVMHNWIQTDAAINLGNSGGPLIDLAGQVIGMDTLIDQSGDSLGFALPVNTIKDAVNQLKTFGNVSRPYLGVVFQPIDSALQASNNLPVKNGAFVQSVVDGGPAKISGVQAGDIITGVDNYNVDLQNRLDAIIQKYQSGNQVTLKILRGTQKLELPVVVGEIK